MKPKPLLLLTSVLLVLATFAAHACGEEEETPGPSPFTKETPSASPSPNDPFTTDSGVLQGTVHGDYQMCESDAIVYIKDQRVDETVRKGRKVEISVGESVVTQSGERLTERDEVLVGWPVYRRDDDVLVAGYRRRIPGLSSAATP